MHVWHENILLVSILLHCLVSKQVSSDIIYEQVHKNVWITNLLGHSLLLKDDILFSQETRNIAHLISIIEFLFPKSPK